MRKYFTLLTLILLSVSFVYSQNVTFTGNIVPYAQVNIIPKVPGKVMKIYVDEGSSVTEGSRLCQIDTIDIYIQLQQAEAGLQTAKIGYEQIKLTAKDAFYGKLIQAKMGLAVAEAGLYKLEIAGELQAKSQMEQAKETLAALKAKYQMVLTGAREQEIKQVEAGLAQAKANYEKTKTDYERMETLFKAGGISQQQFDAIKTGYTVAEAQFSSASQQYLIIKEGARKEDREALEAQVNQAEVGYELAKKMYEAKLWEKDIASAKLQVEQTRIGVATLESLEKAESWKDDIENVRLRLSQAESAVQLLRNQVDNATIRAPISGIITKKTIEEGTMAGQQSPVFIMMGVDYVYAQVNIIEKDLTKVETGKSATVTVDAYPDKTFTGKITGINPVIDPMTKTATFKVKLQNTGRKLIPGMFVRVTLSAKKRK